MCRWAASRHSRSHLNIMRWATVGIQVIQHLLGRDDARGHADGPQLGASPGVIMEAIGASMCLTLGPGALLSYTLQGLFHPMCKVHKVVNKSIGRYTMCFMSVRLMCSSCSTLMFQSLVRARMV